MFFDLRGWGFKISQDVQLLFFRPKTIEMDVLRENKTQAPFPAVLGSMCLIEAYFDGHYLFRIVLDPCVYPCFLRQ